MGGVFSPPCLNASMTQKLPLWESSDYPPQTLEVNAKVGGGLVTQFEVFFQGLVENLLQFWRQLGIEFQWRDGGAVENCVEHGSTCRTGKRGPSRGHFVQNDPQRK